MSKKQKGLLQLTGETQNMVIYKKKDGEFAFRRKGGVSPERYATDSNYEAVRMNSQDFAKAGKASILIKRAFAPMTPAYVNNDITSGLPASVNKSLNRTWSTNAGRAASGTGISACSRVSNSTRTVP
ncbi:hypothetical protein [Chitinophaga sp. 22620]|uniref:hypothetical protein n=1 Tax=Chitinophaga sp. 22620 TaxID=3453952 RepID=UPI003F8542D5